MQFSWGILTINSISLEKLLSQYVLIVIILRGMNYHDLPFMSKPESYAKGDKMSIEEWREKAGLWDKLRKELVFHNWSYEDMVKKIKEWGNDSWKLMEIENLLARKVQEKQNSKT